VTDVDDLRRRWAHQLRFFFDKAYRLDPLGHREIRERWDALVAPPTTEGPEPSEEPVGA
jgi:hypothetical protein